MSEKREKIYTVSARLVFSSIIVVLLLLGAAFVAGNIGPVGSNGAPIIVQATCSSASPFGCQSSNFNYTTGALTVAIIQKSGYNWTAVTVRFVPSNTAYSNGVPELSWSPPMAVNVTGGLLNNTVRYVNIPITSGPVAVGTDITGSIWAKYQLRVGGAVSYANMTSAFIQVKR
jgi:hypothetical protein